MHTAHKNSSWREVESLSVSQVATLFGRSTHWVRDRIDSGHLVVATRDPKTMVTTRSVSELLDDLAPRRPTFQVIQGGRA